MIVDRTLSHDALRLVRLILLGIASAAGLLVLSAILSTSSASAAGPERSGLLDGVEDVVSGTVDTVGSTVSGTTEVASTVVEKTVEKVVAPVAETVVRAADPVVPAPAKPVVQAVTPVVSGVTEAVTETVDDTAAAAVEAAPSPVSSVATPITETVDGLVGSLPVVGAITGPSLLTDATDDITGAVDDLVIGDVVGTIRDVVGTVGTIGDTVVDVVDETPDSVTPLLPVFPMPTLVNGGALGAVTSPGALTVPAGAAASGGLLASGFERSDFRTPLSGGASASTSSGSTVLLPSSPSHPLGAPVSSPLDESTANYPSAGGFAAADTASQVAAPAAATGLSTLPLDEVLPSSLSSRTLPSPD